MNIKLSTKARGLKEDVMVTGVFEDKKSSLGNIKKGQTRLLIMKPSDGKLVLAIGMGKSSGLSHESLRQAASMIHSRAKSEKWSRVVLDFESLKAGRTLKEGLGIQSLVEGLLLSDYRFDHYKSSNDTKPSLKEVVIIINPKDLAKAQREFKEAGVIAEGVCLARDLGNEPANVLYPESFASRVKRLALKDGVKCRIMDEKQLASLKMGGLLGVGQGSIRKPCMVIMEYKPARAKNKKPIVLVGKGITFDTGGISIKPSKAMDEMKFDMCGAAAVTGACLTVARLKLPLHVMSITPLAENMPGDNAQRPGDIIKCYNGKSVEVLNTDAEGRLVLADALAYAKNFKPLCIVDAATLTGLAAYFFDFYATSMMGTSPEVMKRLKEAGDRSGERVWGLPLWEEYGEMVKGTYADIQNVSRQSAGTITAAMFLKHFADHSPWVHLDIAGTAWTTSPKPYTPIGASGVGVRLFIEFLKSYL